MARIALGVTGSVAAIRVPALVDALRLAGHDARVVATEPALYFFDPADLPAPSDRDAVPPLGRKVLFRDADEWWRREAAGRPWGVYQREDTVLHIDLRRWAELLVIAPLDANTLAKLAYGLSDNLLTCLYRAWDPARPMLLAPAMNTFMWESPLTRRHLRLLLELHAAPGEAGIAADVSLDDLMTAINTRCPRLRICPPQSKRLACGDEGMGAMAEVDAIVAAAKIALQTGE
jgi:phosphopantothenoylcysteine decarboxylase